MFNTDENNTPEVEATETPKRRKVSKEDRIAELKALREKELERHAEKMAYYDNLIATWEAKGDKMSGVEFEAGQVVSFTYGRPGHVQKEMTGTVLGFKDVGKGGMFAVIRAGEGIDMEVVKVRPSQVIGVIEA